MIVSFSEEKPFISIPKTFLSLAKRVAEKMFTKIETAIISVLQDHLDAVPKENIGVKKPKPRGSLPAISLTNIDYEIKDVGVGRSISRQGKAVQDTFNGDGKRKEFALTENPLRPLIRVEHPRGKTLREDDYDVDYEKAVVRFSSPPKRGKENVVVTYHKPTEIKGLTFSLRYHLNVWAKDEAQRDAVTMNVIEVLLREEDALNRQGIFIKPVRGFNIPPNENVPEEIYGNTTEYQIEADLQIEVPRPRIEKVEVQQV